MTTEFKTVYSKSIRDRMRDMRERGDSLRVIAKLFQVSHATVSTWMSRPDDYRPFVRSGRDINGNGKPYLTNGKPVGSTRYSEETKQAAREMHKQGMSYASVSRLIGVPQPTLHIWCRPEFAEMRKKYHANRYKENKKYYGDARRSATAKRKEIRDDALKHLELRGLSFFYKGEVLATCPDEQAVSVVADIMNLIGREGFPEQR